MTGKIRAPEFDKQQTAAKVILFNKPFNVLCQFTDKSADSGGERATLADYIQQPGYYPAGRLDRDSEGLLILTNDGRLQSRISHPRYKMAKNYYVQVEGEIDRLALLSLSQGVQLKDGVTQPATARAIGEPDWLWPRTPPIRERKQIPTSWLSLTLHEGKNRQVRRMTAAVGFPTLRLIRTQIGPWSLQGLATGQWRYDKR